MGKDNSKKLIAFIGTIIILFVFGFSIASASFNEEMNYQGKLTDSSNIPVADGGYNFRFRLCITSDCSDSSDPIWTETHCYSSDNGTNCDGTGTDQRVSVSSGLFSVLLGSISSLSSVNFNQPLWLEVQVGGSGTTPSWETLTPRKKLGVAPAAFEAGKLGGYTWASPGAIGSATPNSGSFTSLSSTGVTTLGNNTATLTIDSSDWDVSSTGDMTGIGSITADGTITFSSLTTAGPVITSSAGVLSSEALLAVNRGGTGLDGSAAANGTLLIGNGSGYTLSTLTGTSNQIIVTNGAGSITLSTPQDIATSSSPTFGGLTLSNLTEGSVLFAGSSGVVSQDNTNLFWDNTNKRLGIGITSPGSLLDVNGTAQLRGSSGGTGLYVDSSGNIGIGTTSPGTKLHVVKSGSGYTPYNSDSVASFQNSDHAYVEVLAGSGKTAGILLGTDGAAANGVTYSLSSNTLSLMIGGDATLLSLDYQGNVSFSLGSSGTFDVGSGKLYVDTAGNVGIGTTSPAFKLDTRSNNDGVNGIFVDNESTQSNAGTRLWLYTEGGGDADILFKDGDNIYWNIGVDNSDYGKFKISGDGELGLENYITIDKGTGGNVGIGTTSPQQKLTLASASNFATEMAIPTGVTATAGTGGTLNGTYYYKVSASDGVGWTNVSSEVSATVDGGTTNGTITVSWTAVTGATKYRVWRGTSSNGENEYYETTSTSLADDGSLTFTAGTAPTVTTAYVNKLTASGSSWLLGGNVGIGTTAPGSLLDVNGTAQLRGSSGGTGLYVDSSGNVGIGTTSPGYQLHVTKVWTHGTVSAEYEKGVYFNQFWNPTSNASGELVALDATARTSNHPYDIGDLYGFYGGTRHKGTGTVSTASGLYGRTWNDGTGTITTGNGLVGVILNDSGATINSARGILATITNSGTIDVASLIRGSITNSGTITTLYGLYIPNVSGIATTNNYAIYSAGGTNYFGGNVGIGTTSPSFALDVNGVAQISDYLKVSGSDDTIYGIDVYKNFTSTTTNPVGISLSAMYNGAGDMAGTMYGLWLSAETKDTYDLYTLSNIIGIKGVVNLWGDGNVTNAYGSQFQINNRAGATVTSAIGFYVQDTQNLGSGSITSAQGLRIGDQSVATGNSYGIYISSQDTVSGLAHYGIYIGNITGATNNNYAIYSAGGTNYFGGNVGIGTTSPESKLDIRGDLFIPAADSTVDCDGSASSGVGSCDTISDGATLVSMGSDKLDFDNDGLADGQPLCTDSLTSPTIVAEDDDNNCSNGAGGTVILGTPDGSETITVGSFWAFKDDDGDSLLDNGEDLYIDNSPPKKYFASGGSVLSVDSNTGVAINGPIDPEGADLSVYDVYSGGGAIKVFDNNRILKHQFGGSAFNVMNGAYIRTYTGDTSSTKTFEVASSTGNAYFGGNVGIGTTNPGAKLEVAGKMILGNQDSDNVIVLRDAGGMSRLQLGVTSADYGVINALHGLLFITDTDNNNTAADFIWGTNGSSNTYTELMRLTDEGNLGIGTTSPGSLLDVNGTAQLRGSSGGTGLYVDSSGNVGIGTTSPEGILNIVDGDDKDTIVNIDSFASDVMYHESDLVLRRARGTRSSPAAVAGGDSLGAVVFKGYDGANYINAGYILGKVDGTPGTSDMPGRIQFYTTPDGSDSPQPRMTIKSDGKIGIGTTSPSFALDVKARSSVGAPTFTGTGLDDMSTGGTFTGATALNYKVEIDGTGTPDTFKWSDDGGTTWDATGVAITGSAQTLNNGVTITFTNATGHTLGDYWTFSTTVTNPLAIQNAAGTRSLYVGNDGNVGIGTTSPGAKLEINYSSGYPIEIRPSTTGNGIMPVILYRNNFNGTANFMLVSGNNTYFGAYDGAMPSDPSKMIRFYLSSDVVPALMIGDSESGSSARLEIGGSVKIQNGGVSYFNGGNVGIGTTAPTDKLTLANTGVGNQVGIRFIDPTSSTYGARIYFDDTPNVFKIVTINNDVESLGIGIDRNTGNVGIGTTSPGEKLDVNGNIAASGTIYYGDSNRWLSRITSNGTSTGTLYDIGIVWDTNGSGDLGINNGLGFVGYDYATFGTRQYKTALVVANSTGNVGIGTTSPGTKLSVSGGSSIKELLEADMFNSPYGGIGSYENEVTYSEEFDNSAWIKDYGSITANATTAPDGTVTADKFVPDTSVNGHRVKQTVESLTAGHTYTGSVYVKKAGYDFRLLIWNANGSSAVVVDLDDGSILGTSGNEYVDSSVFSLPNDWYRVSLTFTTVNGGNYIMMNYTYDNGTATFAGDGTSGIYLWGAQLEESDFPRVYVKTGSAAVLSASGFYTSNDLIINDSGNVGIGTTSPAAKLDIRGSSGDYLFSLGESHNKISTGCMLSMAASGNFPFEIISASDNSSWRPIINWYRARGSVGSYSAVQSGDYLGSVQGKGYDGSSWIDAATLDFKVDGTVSTGIVPARIEFRTMDTTGDLTQRLVIKNNGYVGIGTTSPQAKLHVAGGARITDLASCDVIYTNANGDLQCGTNTAAAFDAYDNAGGQTFTSTAITINIDTIRQNNSNYTLASDEITVNSDGLYQVTFTCSVDISSGTDRSDARCWLEADTGAGFSEVDGSRCWTYNRIDTAAENSCGRTVILSLNSTDKIRLRAVRHAGASTLVTLADGSSITINKLISAGSDLAEIYYTNDEALEAGDVVSIDTTLESGIQKSRTPYDNKLLGIVSTHPRLVMGHEYEPVSTGRPILIALSGRVPVKIDSSSLPIGPGDYLTSSDIPGRAMKATQPGLVIGRALESWDPKDPKDKIFVFVNLGWYGGSLTEEGSLAEEGSDNEKETSSEGVLDEFTQKVKEALASLGLQIKNGVAQVKELAAERVTTKELCLEDGGDKVCLNKDQLRQLLEKNQMQISTGSNNNSNNSSGSSGSEAGETTDNVPPETTIESHPEKANNSTEATFTFSSNEENSVFQCNLNNQGWEDCVSPKQYENLTDGDYQFEVRAIDSAGNVDQSPATFSWTVDTTNSVENKDNSSSCGADNLDLCMTKELCEGAGLSWYDETCHSEEQGQDSDTEGKETGQTEETEGTEGTTCTPDWSCADWESAPDNLTCGETFTQTRTCTDLNNCGVNEGKPAETQEVTGTNAGNTVCDASKNLVGECQNTCDNGTVQECTPSCTCAEGFSDCDNDMSNGCETQGDCQTQTQENTSVGE